MKMKMKRIIGFFLALVMFIGCLPLSTIETYAAEGDVAIDEAHFPDKIFRNYVKANFDENGDGNLSKDELDKVEKINITNKSVSSLKGIEHFKNLTKLDCSNNKLTSLDISKNTNLTELNCGRNKLTSLNISKNTNLTVLNCGRNKLTELDVRQKINLTVLNCDYNKLSKLDVSKNTNLTALSCDGNNLSKLDVSKNTNLTALSCADNKLSKLDVSKNTALEQLICNYNKLSELDVSKNTNLEKLNCADNKLSELDVSKNTALIQLDCYDINLSELDVSKNTALIQLNCGDNKLSELDVSKNTALEGLYCGYNYQISELDISKNTALKELSCYWNKLTELNLSKNTNLKKLNCNNNKLSELDTSNNKALEELSCSFNNLSTLDISKNTALKQLSCTNNKLSQLDVSKNTTLVQLSCTNNKLSQLDVSKNTALVQLSCGSNKLSQLDVSKNTALVQLSCGSNKLSQLDVSKNTTLTTLYCSNQQYDITVTKGIREFKYSKFPGQFKREKVTSPDGASFGDVALTVDSDTTNKVTYNYIVGNNIEMDVKLNVTYIEFDQEHVESMKVKEQPKLIYTEGEKLDLSGLVVTLTDKQGLTKDVAFKDFEENNITANPENETELTLADNGKKVTLTKGNLTAETNALTVNKKVFDPEHVERMVVKTQPKLIYTEGEKLDLTGLVVTLTDKQGLTKNVEFKDFKENNITANPENETELKLADSGKKVTLTKGNLTAETEALTVNKKETPSPLPKPIDPPVAPTQPGGEPADTSKYWTVTFESADETKGVVDAKNTFYVLKTENKTLADITAPKATAKVGYEFDKWDSALDKNTVIDKDMTVKAYFKKVGSPTPKKPPVVGPVDPQDPNGEKPADTSKYYTVTFKADPAKGTIDAKNTFYVLKNSGKTLADLANDAPKVIAKPRFKFTGWEPTLDANTTINKDMTVNAKFEKVTPTPTDPPVNPTQPGVKSQVANNKALPKTASSINIELYTIFMILSGTLLVVAFKRKKESQ